MTISAKVSSDKQTLTIHIDGRFDFSSLQAFKDVYESQNNIFPNYVINLKDADYLDSSALGMLLALREYAGGESANISIENCNPDIKKILRITKLDDLFTVG